jgi:hypothetical protein
VHKSEEYLGEIAPGRLDGRDLSTMFESLLLVRRLPE